MDKLVSNGYHKRSEDLPLFSFCWDQTVLARLPVELHPLIFHHCASPGDVHLLIRDLRSRPRVTITPSKAETKLAKYLETLEASHRAAIQLEGELTKLKRRVDALAQHQAAPPKKEKLKERRFLKPPESTIADFFAANPENKRFAQHFTTVFYLIKVGPQAYFHDLWARLPTAKERSNLSRILFTGIFPQNGQEFAPLEDFLMLQIFAQMLKKHVADPDSLQPFFKHYTRRNEGKKYAQNQFSTLISNLSSTKEGEDRSKVSFGTAKELEKSCDEFYEKIISSLDQIPYGWRRICRSVHDLLPPQTSLRDTGSYFFNLFISFILQKPKHYGIQTEDPPTKKIAGVMAALRAVFLFEAPKKLKFDLNEWITSKHHQTRKFLGALINVGEPGQHLGVNEYCLSGPIFFVLSSQDVLTLNELTRVYDKDKLSYDYREGSHRVLELFDAFQRYRAPELPVDVTPPVQISIDRTWEKKYFGYARYLRDCSDDVKKLELIKSFVKVFQEHKPKKYPYKSSTPKTLKDYLIHQYTNPGLNSRAYEAKTLDDDLFNACDIAYILNDQEDIVKTEGPPEKRKNQARAAHRASSGIQLVRPFESFFDDSFAYTFFKEVENRLNGTHDIEIQRQLQRLKFGMKYTEDLLKERKAQFRELESKLDAIRNSPCTLKAKKWSRKEYKFALVADYDRAVVPHVQASEIRLVFTQIQYGLFEVKAGLKGNTTVHGDFMLDLIDVLDPGHSPTATNNYCALKKTFTVQGGMGLALSVPALLEFLTQNFFKK